MNKLNEYEILKLPKKRKNEDIKIFVSDTLQNYDSLLASLDENILTTFELNGIKYTKEKLIEWVSIISHGINEALRVHSYTEPTLAFNALKKCLNEVNLIDKIELQKSTCGLYFYRMRCNVSENEFNANTNKLPIKSMLHIPLKNKDRAGYERFSIKHIPALYLSNSVFGCYHELDLKYNENLNSFVSMVEFEKTNIKVFDLQVRNNIVDKFKENSFQDMFAYLLMFPLIFACSIIKEDTKNAIKPEYIIPQLFIEWLEEQNNNMNFFGIAYSSTKVNQTVVDKPSLFYNVVIPTRIHGDKHDYCEKICENLRFTEPINFLDNFVMAETEMFGGFITSSNVGKEHWNSIISNSKLYEASEFGNIEKKLYSLLTEYPFN